MKLHGRDLRIRMRGEAVKLLHKELRQLGFDIQKDEVARAFFGTRAGEAVNTFQKAHKLEASGIVDERIGALIRRDVDKQKARPPESFVVKRCVVHADGKPSGGGLCASSTNSCAAKKRTPA